MSLSSLIIVVLLIILISFYVMSYDKIVNELKEIRTKCIKINNISDNSMEDNNGDEEISPKKKKRKRKKVLVIIMDQLVGDMDYHHVISLEIQESIKSCKNNVYLVICLIFNILKIYSHN